MDVLLTLPDAAEVRMLGRGVVSAVSGPDGLTDLQKIVIAAVFHSMTGHDLDVDAVQPIGATDGRREWRGFALPGQAARQAARWWPT